MSKNHSPNCECVHCTGNDSYLKEVRRRYGKNANFSLAARSGVYGSIGGFNNYSGHFFDHADAAPVTAPLTSPEQVDLKKLLGNALGGMVGEVIQAKKDGKVLSPVLDKVATLGIKTEQAAVAAAQDKAEQTIGQKILKFSPYIIAAVAGIILWAVFLGGRSSK